MALTDRFSRAHTDRDAAAPRVGTARPARTPHPLRAAVALSLALLLGAATPATPASAVTLWGADGHQMAARAAFAALPKDMPVFFAAAGDELAWLNPDPDRWRDRAEGQLDPALGGHASPEHYVDLEWTTPGSLKAPDRVAFMDSLRAAGQRKVPGFAPYRILELTQRLRSQFRAWRRTPEGAERRFLERRIVNDAGILGHYVTDVANPHHTSEHHNGWVGPNPDGFTTDNQFHFRFESQYVRRHITLADITPRVRAEAVVHRATREAIWGHIQASHAQLRRLYTLDKQEPFGEGTTGAEHRAFAGERLAAGASMLRDLWWTAWVMSGDPLPPAPPR